MSIRRIVSPWTSQPQIAAQIDWSNPITRDLIMAVVGCSVVDSVSGRLGYGGNTTNVDVALTGAALGSMGWASATNLTHGAPFYGRPGGIPADPSKFTLLQWRRLLSSGSYATSNIGGWVNSSSNAFRLGIRYSTANFYPAAGSAVMEVSGSLKDDLWHMLGVSLGGGTAGAWIDGVRRAFATSVASPSFNLTASYDIFQLPASPLSMLWERELSAAEQLSLYQNPWQIFKPIARLVRIRNASGINGNLSVTMRATTMGATSKLAIKGNLSSTMRAATLAAQARLAAKADANITLKPTTLDATGSVQPTATGAFEATMAAATLSAQGHVANTGAMVSTLRATSLAAEGRVRVGATFEVTMKPTTLSATAAAAIRANAAIALRETAVDAFGVLQVQGGGSAFITMAPTTVAATAALAVKGQAVIAMLATTVEATGSLQAAGTGSMITTLRPMTLDAQGKLAVAGSATITLRATTLDATGATQPMASGTFVVTMRRTTLEARGLPTPIFGTFETWMRATTLLSTGGIPPEVDFHPSKIRRITYNGDARYVLTNSKKLRIIQ